MGTDIHMVVQRKNEQGKWEDVAHNYDEGRDYTLFAWLGDVRNGTGFAGVPTHNRIDPLSSNRGLPHDFEVTGDPEEGSACHPITSLDVMGEYRRKYHVPGEPMEIWMGYHDYSWLTADEILSVKPPRIIRTGVVGREFYDKWDGESAPDGWSGGIWGRGLVISNPSEITDATTHVQIEWLEETEESLRYFVDEVRLLKELHGEVRFVFGFDS